MTSQTPLHFNPLRPSRNQLRGVTWPTQPQSRRSSNAPFAYLHTPFVADSTERYVSAEEMGHFSNETQMWVFPSDHIEMGFNTMTRSQNPKSPPTATWPGEQPDYDYVADDACQ